MDVPELPVLFSDVRCLNGKPEVMMYVYTQCMFCNGLNGIFGLNLKVSLHGK